MLHTLGRATELLARCLWPGRCAGCGALRTLLDELFCLSCEVEVRPAGRVPLPEGIDHAWSCFEYNAAVQSALHAWKYNGRAALGGALTDAMVAWLLSLVQQQHLDGDHPVEVIPVPMHPRRLKERGFDQTWQLAHGVARRRPHWRLRPDALRRTRHTPHQVGLDRLARARNTRDAFTLGRRPARGARVWLIDDVITTGATTSACARLLRSHGAESITLLTIAHAKP